MYDKEIVTLKKFGVRVQAVRTYAGLGSVRDDFLVGSGGYKLPFLIIVGPPGVAKSHQFERQPGTFYVNNAASAVGIYAAAYRHLDKPLIFDDVDDLFGQPAVVALFKALGADRDQKPVAWLKQNPWLESQGIPADYETTSRLCVLLNDFPKLTKNMAAVFDRAKTVVFIPTPAEVHAYVGGWFPKDERTRDIYDYIGEHLSNVTVPSCRWYTDALKEARLGNNWRQWLLEVWYDEAPLVSVAGEVARKFPKGAAREAEWAKRTGLKRRSFYDYQRKYEETQGQATVGA